MTADVKPRAERLDRALSLERAGRAREALAELEALAGESPDSPRLLVHLGRALQFAGRAAEAEARIAAGLTTWPTDATLHALFAELRWQGGSGVAATAMLEAAIVAHPRELQLRLVAADLLRNMGFADRARALLEGGLLAAPDSAAFLTSLGVVLEDLGRVDEALPLLRAAVPRARDPARARRNLVPALLRSGAAAEAMEVCESLLAAAPDDQMVLAYYATALRLLGDARHAALCDYARLVRVYDPAPPPNYRDVDEFNVAFAHELRALHRQSHRPIAQSLRGGTQTERHLPPANPVIADFFAMIDVPIRDYLARLEPGSAHPVDRRRRAAHAIAGSWSVLLAPGGFHVDHVHPEGWLSSAYYVEIPDSGGDGERAGWLKFGEPGVKLGLAPEHFVEPRAGRLVLFPSYFWHGTVPFERGGGRLTAAFDVVPA